MILTLGFTETQTSHQPKMPVSRGQVAEARRISEEVKYMSVTDMTPRQL